MGIFLWAAIAGFLLFGAGQASPRLRGVVAHFWLHLSLGALLMLALVVALVALGTGWPAYSIVLLTHRSTGPEVVRFVLGLVFGGLIRYWGGQWAWGLELPLAVYARQGVILIALLLLADAAPFMGTIFRSLAGVKTPVAEFSFAAARDEERAVFEAKREKTALQSLGQVVTFASTIIARDMAYQQVQKELAERIPDARAKRQALKDVADRQEILANVREFFSRILIPPLKCAADARAAHHSLHGVRDLIRPVTQGLARLMRASPATAAKPTTDPYDRFVAVVGATHQALDRSFGCDRHALAAWPTESLPRGGPWLDSSYLHLALAELLLFDDDVEAASSHLIPRVTKATDVDALNVRLFAARLLYMGDRDSRSIFEQLDQGLRFSDQAWSRLAAEAGNRPVPAGLPAQKRRLEVARRIFKDLLAYVSAQAGEREAAALLDAEDNYRARAEVPDLDVRTAWVDTFGYVKMAFAARRTPPSVDDLREAKKLFDEALSMVKSLPDSEERAIYVRAIEDHRAQADRLLGGRR